MSFLIPSPIQHRQPKSNSLSDQNKFPPSPPHKFPSINPIIIQPHQLDFVSIPLFLERLPFLKRHWKNGNLIQFLRLECREVWSTRELDNGTSLLRMNVCLV